MGPDKAKEPVEKKPNKQSPTLAVRPKKYALEMWVEIETSVGMYSTPRKTLTARRAILVFPLNMQTALLRITCCLPFSCRPRCALVWGMVVRGFARRDLC